MAVRQYIGARYVPKFFENSSGTAEWTANTAYEPLTVVTRNGNSYTSKKYVPPEIGGPEANPSYWASTGIYNAQIDEYRREVAEVASDLQETQGDVTTLNTNLEALGTRLDETVDDLNEEMGQVRTDVEAEIAGFAANAAQQLKGKKIVVLGDSLAIGSGAALGHTWIENLATMYGAETYNYGVSGSKIANGETPSASDMATRIIAILQAHDELDYFILWGGANDKNANVHLGSPNDTTADTFCGAIKYIIAKVREKYRSRCKMLCINTPHRFNTANDIGMKEWDYAQGMLMTCASVGVPCYNAYSNMLSLCREAGNVYDWVDITYDTPSANTHHYSVGAYRYMTPLMAQWIINPGGANDAAPLNYKSITGLTSPVTATLYNKSRLANGNGIITLRATLSGVRGTESWSDGNGYSPDIRIEFPKEYRVTNAIPFMSYRPNAGFGHVVLRGMDAASVTFRVYKPGSAASANPNLDGYVYFCFVGFDNNIY